MKVEDTVILHIPAISNVIVSDAAGTTCTLGAPHELAEARLNLGVEEADALAEEEALLWRQHVNDLVVVANNKHDMFTKSAKLLFGVVDFRGCTRNLER